MQECIAIVKRGVRPRLRRCERHRVCGILGVVTLYAVEGYLSWSADVKRGEHDTHRRRLGALVFLKD